MAPLTVARPDQEGTTRQGNRRFMEGVLQLLRTHSLWRVLPRAFGDWDRVFRRFTGWSDTGVWRCIFEAVPDVSDFE
jgi:putative transposase